jgi:polyhydroxyalkanoate synthesis regulator phasin
MNSDTLLELFQTSFRTTLGATSSLVEAIQDPQRMPQTLNQTWSQFTTNPNQLLQDWADKGAVTEQEARQVVDRLWQQQRNPSAVGVTVNTTATPVAPDVQTELQALTEQLISLREELAQLRQQRSQGS